MLRGTSVISMVVEKIQIHRDDLPHDYRIQKRRQHNVSVSMDHKCTLDLQQQTRKLRTYCLSEGEAALDWSRLANARRQVREHGL